MTRFVYASPDDSFWDTLVVLSLAEDSETLLPAEKPQAADDKPADPSSEERSVQGRKPR